MFKWKSLVITVTKNMLIEFIYNFSGVILSFFAITLKYLNVLISGKSKITPFNNEANPLLRSNLVGSRKNTGLQSLHSSYFMLYQFSPSSENYALHRSGAIANHTITY